MIRDARDPEVRPIPDRADIDAPDKRHGPRRISVGRRAEDTDDVGTEDLRALIAALAKALDREREDRIRERQEIKDEIKRGFEDVQDDVTDLRNNYTSINTRLIRWGAAIGVVGVLLMWIGPSRVVALVKALFNTP